MPLRVDLDDPQLDVLTFAHNLLRMRDPLVTQLGDVHQALNAGLELGERAELGQLGDLGRYGIADVVLLLDARPGVLLDLLQAEGDLLVLAVDANHAHVDLLADAQHLTGVLDLAPAQLGQVDQAIGAAEVDKGAEVGQARDAAVADLAGL